MAETSWPPTDGSSRCARSSTTGRRILFFRVLTTAQRRRTSTGRAVPGIAAGKRDGGDRTAHLGRSGVRRIPIQPLGGKDRCELSLEEEL